MDSSTPPRVKPDASRGDRWPSTWDRRYGARPSTPAGHAATADDFRFLGGLVEDIEV